MKTIFALFLLSGLLTSCSPTLSPFTQRLYDQHEWSDTELKKIQFYLSEDVVMRRELSGGKSEILSGEIKIIDGRELEEVRIPRGTPGILMFRPKEDRFAISFEEGNDERYLVFGPNPKQGGRYVLLASEWRRRQGKVTYEGKKFDVEASSAFSSLMVDLKKIRKTSVRSRTAGGRKVG